MWRQLSTAGRVCARCSSVALRPLVRDHVALPSLAAWHTRRHAEPSISNICRTFATKAAREEDAHGRKVDSHNTQEAAFETSSAPPDVAADASAALDHDAGITGTSEATLRKADRVFDANKCAFVKSCTSVAQLPTSGLPEFAFIGRSNVGKSSLLNALMNRKSLVKTSSKPGHTRMMNLFSVGQRLVLVDLPGYGFRGREDWMGMIDEYFSSRRTLRRVSLLVDCMHGMKASDKEAARLLEDTGIPYQIVLTKTDRCSSKEVSSRVAEVEDFIRANLPMCAPAVFPTSCKGKRGLAELRAALLRDSPET